MAGRSKECQNTACRNYGKRYYASRIWLYSLPQSSYGLDVLANWWLVLVVAGILTFAFTIIQQTWLPDYGLPTFVLVVVILGLAFYWVYTLDKEELWWALIPALSMVVLLATGIVAYITPQDASGSSPYGVITLGLGSAVIGLILKRPAAKFVLYAIAVVTLLVGILMLPVDLIWKIILIVVDVLLIGFLMSQTIRQWNTASQT